MSSLEIVVAVGFAGSVVLVIVVALRRMGWLGKSDRKVSSGVATWLADLNEMLQPQMPTAQQLERLREEGEQDEDEDDADPPDPPGPTPRSSHGPLRP
ncbi:MAG: hypothetical protein AAGF11_42330 [Myxococcota bacterium]